MIDRKDLRSLLPQLRRIGIVKEDLIDMATLESRLREAIFGGHNQVAGPGKSVCGPEPHHEHMKTAIRTQEL